MDEDLVKSIAALAPHLKVNDTVFVSRDLWWTIVSDEMSSEGQVVSSGPAADGLLWYGTGLSIWSLLANGLLLVLLLHGLIRGHVSMLDIPHRWFLVNHVTVQIIICSLVVPLTLAVEKLEGGWPWGGVVCRAWIVGRLWLAGANFWSLLSVVFDRFLCVATPAAYHRWAVNQTERTCRYVAIAGVISTTWLTSALGVVPTLAAINKPDFVLEKLFAAGPRTSAQSIAGYQVLTGLPVCAANLSAYNVLFISVTSFAVPSSLVLIISLAIIVARRRHDVIPPALDYSRFAPDELHQYDVIEDTGNASKHHVTTGTAVSCVEGWCCVVGWCPFYSLGVVAALCPANTMCVDPGVWTMLSWLGFTTVGVVPAVWLAGDSWLRAHSRRLMCAREDHNVEFGHSSAGSTVSTDFTTFERHQ